MTNSEKNSSITSTDYLNLCVIDGILYCIYKDIELVDLETAKICVKQRIEYSENKSYPVLFDITRVKQSTKEGRDYLANEGNDLVIASAILIGSPMLKMSANFFIRVNKPKNPTQMFTDKNSALKWLAQFKS
ncbi:DUF7793 family protein [Pontibacter vulgaris]|uniref:DUF7793 family protein n=1 Tax=Pontibacter vulgaris TaxID=2905679 RepID=UPI001FA78C79|nr:hypothetical protein [Pontibacter vulgaris]